MAKSFPNTGVTTGLAADRVALTSPFTGMHFYETDTNRMYIYQSTGSWLVQAGPNAVLRTPLETYVLRSAMASGTNTYDVLSGSIQYANSNATGNWTLNVRGDSTNTLDSLLTTSQSITITLICQNGSPAFYQTAMQIDGVSVTPKWSGGTAPTSGNTSSNDVYTFSIIKTASATYTVFASVTKWGL